MISEPEMVGEFGAVETGEVIGGVDPESVKTRRPRRPWLWMLAGGALASIVWGAALSAYGWGDRKPDSHGYQLNRNSCSLIQLKSLGAAIAPRQSTTMGGSGLLEHASLDQLQCFIPLRPKSGDAAGTENGWSTGYTVGIAVALHKKSDPGAEFEARRRVTDLGVVPEAAVAVVPNLGDKAYLLTRDGDVQLRVLEGGAVLSLNLSASTYYQSDDGGDEDGPVGEGPAIPDLSTYRRAMISDMLDLMSSLKQRS